MVIRRTQEELFAMSQSDQSTTEPVIVNKASHFAAKIMAGVGYASYVWNLEDDSLEWSDNFVDLIGLAPIASITSGRGFEKLISAESPQTRYGTVFSGNVEAPPKEGLPYQCLYAINSSNTYNDESVWIEDNGRWFAGENGKPVRAEGIVRLANERRQREESLRIKSDFDELTGLPNRRFLKESLDRIAANCFNTNKISAFLLVSVERLEMINTTYGFSVGDEVLLKVAEILKSNLRGGDIVARFSGAKFGIILNDCEGGELFIAAKRFQASIESGLVRTEKGPVALRSVIGACILPKHATTASASIEVTSLALEEARRESGLRIEIFNPDPVLQARRCEEAELVKEVIEALDAGRMDLAFQPVVDAKNHAVAFHESLLRMKDHAGLVSTAGRFIGTAEKLGLVRFLDMQAQILTLETLIQNPSAKLSLNVSHETSEDPQWISKLAGTLRNAPKVAERLIVEITESQAAGDLRETQKFVGMLKDFGCQVAIDDFGAGYTSFANLRDIDVDIIKIDGSFCRNLLNDQKNQVFIRSLIDLANAFNVKTVVEWVEEVEVAAQLAGWGVDYLQGAVFGMPLTVAPWSPEKPAEEIPGDRKSGLSLVS